MGSTESDAVCAGAMLSEFTAFDWPVVAEPVETSEPSTVFESSEMIYTHVNQAISKRFIEQVKFSPEKMLFCVKCLQSFS